MVRIPTSVLLAIGLASGADAQNPQPQPTDVYHVMFVKAVPGQAAALLPGLQRQNAIGGAADHKLMLRHVDGDDWDYVLIQHLGPTVTITTKTAPVAQPATDDQSLRGAVERHSDNYVSGPSWEQFSKSMGLAGDPAGVYVVGVHRAVPGHASQLRSALDQTDPNAKVAVNHVTLQHLEGDDWNLLSIQRYNSWQDFAADRVANPSGSADWLDVRQHSAFHRDTIAERFK